MHGSHVHPRVPTVLFLTPTPTGHPLVPAPSSRHPPAPLPALTLLPHACLLALAQPALLTLAAHIHVHLTLAAVLADVLGALDDAAAEEALAAFTAQHVVVEAWGLVPTHAADFISQHLGGWALLPLQRGVFYEKNSSKKQQMNHTHTQEGSTVFATDGPTPYNDQNIHSNPLSPTHMDEKIKSSISLLWGKHIFCNKPNTDIIQTVPRQICKHQSDKNVFKPDVLVHVPSAEMTQPPKKQLLKNWAEIQDCTETNSFQNSTHAKAFKIEDSSSMQSGARSWQALRELC